MFSWKLLLEYTGLNGNCSSANFPQETWKETFVKTSKNEAKNHPANRLQPDPSDQIRAFHFSVHSHSLTCLLWESTSLTKRSRSSLTPAE